MVKSTVITTPTDNQLTVAMLPFAGSDLRAILGHPQHDVLFVASDVVKMAGLHKNAVQNTVKALGNDTNQLKLQEILTGSTEIQCLSELQYQGNWKAQRLFTESLTYQMLLRGHSKESEPFRQWVTEELLPTIRKTGRYDMAEHMDSEVVKQMVAMMGSFKETLKENTEALNKLAEETTEKSAVIDAQAKDITALTEQVNSLQGMIQALSAALEANTSAKQVQDLSNYTFVYGKAPRLSWDKYVMEEFPALYGTLVKDIAVKEAFFLKLEEAVISEGAATGITVPYVNEAYQGKVRRKFDQKDADRLLKDALKFKRFVQEFITSLFSN